MKVTDCEIEGLKIIELAVHGDNRGFFVERFNNDKFAAAGLPVDFVQDNHSRSASGIIRGLHYQYAPAQGKLVGVIRGKVLDVAVDVRLNSPTFGKHLALELSDENGKLLWIPQGFAHGFAVLGDEPADMLYKITANYNPAGEGGIRFDDKELGIDWQISNPIISARDEKQQSFAQYKNSPPIF